MDRPPVDDFVRAMKVLIIGGSGLISSGIVKALHVAAGDQVAAARVVAEIEPGSAPA